MSKNILFIIVLFFSLSSHGGLICQDLFSHNKKSRGLDQNYDFSIRTTLNTFIIDFDKLTSALNLILETYLPGNHLPFEKNEVLKIFAKHQVTLENYRLVAQVVYSLKQFYLVDSTQRETLDPVVLLEFVLKVKNEKKSDLNLDINTNDALTFAGTFYKEIEQLGVSYEGIYHMYISSVIYFKVQNKAFNLLGLSSNQKKNLFKSFFNEISSDSRYFNYSLSEK